MFKQITWNEVYGLWKRGGHYFSKDLEAPMEAERVYVKYDNQSSYIYGYDWLENEKAEERKKCIEKDPAVFLYFEKPSNKGTIRTAEMLVEAETGEERAAIWIAATAKELMEREQGTDVWRYAYRIYEAATDDFLGSRYILWHHAMKKLVPEIVVPWSIIRDLACQDASSVMGVIQMNTALLKSNWRILKYSSLPEGKDPGSMCRINKEQRGLCSTF